MTSAETTLHVALIVGDNGRHAEVVEALREHLADSCGQPCRHPVQLATVDVANADRYLSDSEPDLVVTIGTVAARQVAELRSAIPTLFSFIPRTVWRELKDCCVVDATTRGRVLLDQPAVRLLQLVREIRPDAQSVGVLLGPATAARQVALADAASNASLELKTEHIEAGEDVGSKLRLLATRVDALLALPDLDVYNRNTVYPILLTTYSARIPVIGFSSPMVKAGATAGLFMSPRDVGEAIALAIQTYRSDRTLVVDDTATPYSIEINADVLRSLRLPPVRASEVQKNLKESKQ